MLTQGYYVSSHVNKAGKPAIYTLTQFEATSARRAFPCWDEPALKATFSLTMISAADTVSLSNMPVIDEKPLSEVSASDAGSEESLKTSIKLIKTLKTIKTELKTEESSEEARKWKVTKFDKSAKMSTYLLTFANGHFEYREDSYKSPLTGKDVPLRIYAVSRSPFLLLLFPCIPLATSYLPTALLTTSALYHLLLVTD